MPTSLLDASVFLAGLLQGIGEQYQDAALIDLGERLATSLLPAASSGEEAHGSDPAHIEKGRLDV